MATETQKRALGIRQKQESLAENCIGKNLEDKINDADITSTVREKMHEIRQWCNKCIHNEIQGNQNAKATEYEDELKGKHKWSSKSKPK